MTRHSILPHTAKLDDLRYYCTRFLPSRQQVPPLIIPILALFLLGCNGAVSSSIEDAAPPRIATTQSLHLPPEIKVLTDKKEIEALVKQFEKQDHLSCNGTASSTLDNIKKDLREGNSLDKTRALFRIRFGIGSNSPDDSLAILNDPELEELVFKAAEYPPTLEAAWEAMARVNPERGTKVALFAAKDPAMLREHRRSLIQVLGDCSPTLESAKFLRDQIKETEDDAPSSLANSTAMQLASLYQKASPDLRQSIRNLLLEAVADAPSPSKHYPLVEQLARAPLGNESAFFQAHEAHKECAPYIAIAYASTDPAKARILLSHDPTNGLDDPTRLVKPILLAWKGMDAELNRQLQQLLEKSDSYAVPRLLYQICESDSPERAKAVLGRSNLQLSHRFITAIERLYQPFDASHPLMRRALLMLQAGLFKQLPDQRALLSALHDARSKLDTTLSWALLDLTGRHLQFDSETGQYPNPYPHLLCTEFVPRAQGKLDGLQCYLKYTDDPDNPDEEVLVVFQGRGYLFRPEYLGDWYDLLSVEAVLDLICQHAGITERFNVLPTGDQTASYLWMDPEAFKRLNKQITLGARY